MKFAQVVFCLLLLSGVAMPQTKTVAETSRIAMPGSPLGIAAGFLYGYQGTPAYRFMPPLRQLGAGFTKVYFFWNQLEPQKGRYDWTAVDKFVAQLKSPDEGLISIFSSSEWAARTASAMLPPSPAKDPADYYRFVHDLVKHCKGRVRYWQNDAEPNNPIYWSGTKEEFVSQLKVFYKAVKAADSSAVVVVGGYDGLFGPPGTYQFPNQQAGLNFFAYVMKEGRDAFDVFDLRLYGDPYTIVARVNYMREKMLALGYDKPIICTEYGGPNLFEFRENLKYVPLVIAWSRSMAQPNSKTPAKNQVQELYEHMSGLAPQTQMFLQGCPPELDAKYQRIQSRQVVMRNLLALSAGVQKTIYWYLPAPAIEGDARYDVMALMYGKIGLLHFRDGVIDGRTPTADAFERMAKVLAGVRQVRRVDLPAQPSIFLFEVTRAKHGPAYVAWDRRDAFSGEDSPAVPLEFKWPAKRARAVDALGGTVPVQVMGGMLHTQISLTPVLIEPAR
jgi:hypothetical protein